MTTFKNVYTPAEFAAEILCGHRHVKWVQAQIRAKRIKAFPGRPALIPQSEAIRFTTTSGK